MSVMTRIGLALLFVALGSSFHTAAQPAPTASSTRVVPTLGIYAMPGFKYRAPGLGAGGTIALDPEESSAPLNTVTLQSDASGHCSHSLQMPAADLAAFDRTASATWRIEATPVTIGDDEATVDIRWIRRVPRPGVLLEDSVEREERLTLRDGARGILDVVRAAGPSPSVCETFAIALELRFGSPADELYAGLGFDMWLIDRGAPWAAPQRVRTQATQGADAAYTFPPLRLIGSAGEVTLQSHGVVTGRARRDGTVYLTFDTTESVRDDKGVRSGGGRKRLLVRPGETIEFELPDPLRAKLPPDLQHHDFALRVTTERLW
jgi:hypothetical protein